MPINRSSHDLHDNRFASKKELDVTATNHYTIKSFKPKKVFQTILGLAPWLMPLLSNFCQLMVMIKGPCWNRIKRTPWIFTVVISFNFGRLHPKNTIWCKSSCFVKPWKFLITLSHAILKQRNSEFHVHFCD